MQYEDFTIQIRRGLEDRLVVLVDSPAGQGEGRLAESLLSAPWEGVNGQPLRDLKATSGGNFETRKAVGRALFRALLEERIETLFHESLALLRGTSRGLRVKLKLDVSDPRLAQLAELPWECLYSDRLGGFLALQRRTPVVRFIDVPRPAQPLQAPAALRILVLLSNPGDAPPLDLSAERRAIETSWARTKNVEVTVLEQPTRETLATALRDAARAGSPHHVLHFMGHGSVDPEAGKGSLWFAGDAGEAEPVGGEELVRELADFPDLCLVFLNACSTARSPMAAGAGPFQGVAAALVRGGVPAVAAMQLPISDRAAVELCRVFYRRIAAGDPVDTAMTEGRLALDRKAATKEEWSTPVLFLRLSDGRLFHPAGKGGPRKLLLAASVAVALAGTSVPVLLQRPGNPDPCRQQTSPQALQRLEQGVQLASEKRYPEAVAALRQAVDLDPDFARAHSALGIAEMEMGRYANAQRSLNRAKEKRPGCAEHPYNLGSFLLGRGELESSIQHLKRALELQPGFSAASAELALAYLQAGDPESARKILDEAIRRLPQEDELNPGVRCSLATNLGRVALAERHPQKAIVHFETARRLVPEDDFLRGSEISYLLATAHEMTGNDGAACQELSYFLPLQRDPVTAWEQGAVSLARHLHCAT